MHSAPSVTYPVGRSRLAACLVWSFWLLGAAGAVAWCFQFRGPDWRTGLLLAAVALSAQAARGASRMGQGMELAWNGRAWSCSGRIPLSSAAATVHLDLQALMLVQLRQPASHAVWVWVDRACLPSHWLDLRRALQAAARPRAESAPVPAQP